MPETSDQQQIRDAAAAIAYALANPIRVDILTVLHDGPASQKGLAETLGLPLSKVTHHVTELAKAGAIEIAYTKKVGNVDQHFWRAMTTSSFEADDLALLTRDEHQGLTKTIVGSMMAEMLSSVGAEVIAGDVYSVTAWDRIWLDKTGYKAVNQLASEFMKRMYAVAAESAARSSETKEELKPYIMGVLSFKRSRSTPNISATLEPLGTDEQSGP